MKRFWTILILVVAVAAAAAYYWYKHRPVQGEGEYQTSTIAKGNVQEVITSTGTVEPEESVDVGAQVAGLITDFGADPHDASKVIDFGTQVENGTILAHIDDSLYQASLKQAQAQLDSAKANLEVANATLLQDKAKLVEAENDWTRAQTLGAGEALAKTTYDSYQAVYLTAQAQVGVGEAAVTQAAANISEAEANVYSAQRNVIFCTIKSTVKGVIVDRRVNVGQTVVSSLNTPSLFLIAADLTKIQVWVSVNEADIGRITPGMPVLFEVDAFPDREFKGTVNKVRLNATMTQNVVTYTVEINADNADGTLLPYLTANVRFLVKEQDDVLMVPNAAFRYHPRQADDTASDATAAAPAATGAGTSPSGTSPNGTSRGRRSGSGAGKSKSNTVYVLENGVPKAVTVQTGITDSVVTAVTGGDLKEGDEVITGSYTPQDSSSGGTTNPFAPQVFRGGGGGGGNRRGG